LTGTWNKNLCNMNQAYISSSLIFIVTITILAGEKLNNCSNPNDTCLPYYVIPIHYRIKLTHQMETYDSYLEKLPNLKDEYDSFYFHGESHTTINILQSTQYIKLYMLNLIIGFCCVLIKNNGIIYALKENTVTSKTNLLEISFLNVLSPGLYILKIEFLGRFTENSSKKIFTSFYTNRENGIM